MTDSASTQSSPDVKAAHARLRSMAKMPSETVQTSNGKSLKCSKIFIDIGANIGWYSLLSAHSLKDECKIYAFEPFS